VANEQTCANTRSNGRLIAIGMPNHFVTLDLLFGFRDSKADSQKENQDVKITYFQNE
jgi:hypothetical protein